MDKTLRIVIIACLCVITFSIFYYLVIHLPKSKEIEREEAARKEQSIQAEIKRNEDSLAEVKYWTIKLVPQIGVKCTMSTSWREGRIYYIFEAESMVIDYKHRTEAEYRAMWFRYNVFKGDIRLNARLIDQAGFEILSIEMNEILQVVNDKNVTTMIRQKSNVACSRQKYQDIADWEVTWRK